MEKLLKTMGEGLSDEELNTFMELAVDKDAPNPNSINIRKITEILLPKLESTNMLATMKNPTSNKWGFAQLATAQLRSRPT